MAMTLFSSLHVANHSMISMLGPVDNWFRAQDAELARCQQRSETLRQLVTRFR